MASINGRYILAEKEDLTYEVDITQQPVEREIDVSDHVQRKARTLSISGVVSGTNAAEMHRFLTDCQDKGTLVSFVGRTTMRGLLSGLSTSRDYTVADGFTYSVTITEVLFASSSTEKLAADVKAQTAKVASSGLKQTKNSASSSGNGNAATAIAASTKMPAAAKTAAKAKSVNEIRSFKNKTSNPFEGGG